MTERHRRATSRNAYIYLANNGPQISSDLPNDPTRVDKQDGVRQFGIQGGKGNHMSGAHNHTGVWYIENKHDPETVVSTWIDHNQATVERMSGWAMYHNASEEFRPAIRKLIGFDRDWAGENRGDGTTNNPCPFCGATGIKSIPNHLPDCEERP